MIRSLVLVLATACATLTFTAPRSALAQYGGYSNASQYTPNQPPAIRPYQQGPYGPYQQGPTMQGPYQQGPTMQDLSGTWFMSGDQDEPCQVIPSRLGDRALFVNENGNQAEGFFRGNLIIVPQWGNLRGRFRGHGIRWSNNTLWTR